jgi:hypothetical protein
MEAKTDSEKTICIKDMLKFTFHHLKRILLVFTAVLVEFSDSSSFSQFFGIDFFSFVNSDIQLVFKDSFFKMKFSDNFPSHDLLCH